MSVLIKISDLSKRESEKIDKELTIKPKVSPYQKFGSFQGQEPPVKMYWTTPGVTRIPYFFSKCFFGKDLNSENTYPNIYDNPNGKFSGKLLDRQKEPFKKALEYLKGQRTVTIALYPGFGKTFMGVMLAWYMNKKCCVLVHRENIGLQWVKTFKRYFQGLDEEIWFVNDKPPEKCRIMVSMDGRTDKIPDNWKEDVGLLIIDEAHCFCSKGKVKPMLSFQPKYVIAETATPEKDNGMERMIQMICGKHYIQKISEKPYYFFVVHTGLEYEIEGGGNVYQDLVEAQVGSEERNEMILQILQENPERKAIVASSRVGHCKKIAEGLVERGLESSQLHSTIKNYQPKNILIGTGSKMGVGFDEANFCDDFDGRPSDLLIMTYTFASWAPFEQVRGRGMRTDNPHVVVFHDSHPITRKHLTKMRRWTRETNGIIKEIYPDKMEGWNLESWK